jgi:hypothetical protein
VRRDVARQIRGISKAIFPYYLSFTQDIQPDPICFGCISMHSDSYIELESDCQNSGLNLAEKSLLGFR